MTQKPKAGAGTPAARKRITLERIYQADVQDVWDLWTTRDGIESWWGPGGFAVTVRKLDLRADCGVAGRGAAFARVRDRDLSNA